MVYFWKGAPNMHCAKVHVRAPVRFMNESMSGKTHSDPWSACRYRLGSPRSPLSAGFSTMNSTPFSCAAARRAHMRTVISFARLSSLD